MIKENRNMAIAYDFDGTLAPGNMQEYNFIFLNTQSLAGFAIVP